MTKPIDWTKPVETVTGKKVVILTTEAKGAYYGEVVGQLLTEFGEPQDAIDQWSLDGLHMNGRYGKASANLNLRNPVVKQERWVWAYVDSSDSTKRILSVAHPTKEQAELHRKLCPLFKTFESVKIEWEE